MFRSPRTTVCRPLPALYLATAIMAVDYGKLTVFQTPAGVSIDGPALIDARILANTTVSQKITLLNSGGSTVVLGNLLVVPVDGAILYFRPLYVQGRNSFPVLQEVIGVYGGQGSSQVYMVTTLARRWTTSSGHVSVDAFDSAKGSVSSIEESTALRTGAVAHRTGKPAPSEDPDGSARRQPRPVPKGCRLAFDGRSEAESADHPAEEEQLDDDHHKSDHHDHQSDFDNFDDLLEHVDIHCVIYVHVRRNDEHLLGDEVFFEHVDHRRSCLTFRTAASGSARRVRCSRACRGSGARWYRVGLRRGVEQSGSSSGS